MASKSTCCGTNKTTGTQCRNPRSDTSGVRQTDGSWFCHKHADQANPHLIVRAASDDDMSEGTVHEKIDEQISIKDREIAELREQIERLNASSDVPMAVMTMVAAKRVTKTLMADGERLRTELIARIADLERQKEQLTAAVLSQTGSMREWAPTSGEAAEITSNLERLFTEYLAAPDDDIVVDELSKALRSMRTV